MKNAVIYARYSSERQTEQSIEGQIHVCEEYAKRNDIKILRTYEDKAKNGKNDNRDGFQDMMKDAAKKKFEIILVYSLDRFSRNRYNTAVNKNTLKKYGVKVVSATQPISDSPEGIILEGMLESFAEYYSVELAQKVKRGMRESAQKGLYLGGKVTYGYKIKNKKYVINKAEANIVRTCFTLFREKKNYVSILNYLQENNILNRRHGNFKRHQLKNMLSNEVYIGTLKFGEEKFPNKIPAIISEEEFKEVQSIMENSKINITKSPERFLLTGKIFCGECGSSIVGDSGTSKSGKIHYYYNCLTRKKKNGCNLERYKKNELENFVYKRCVEELKKPEVTQYLVARVKKEVESLEFSEHEKELKKQLQSIDQKLDAIVEAVENGMYSEKLKQQNDELVEKQECLQAELDSLQSHPFKNLTEEKIENFILKKYVKSNKEQIINNLVNTVRVYKNGKIVIVFNIYDPHDPNSKRLYEAQINSAIESLVSKCSNKFPDVPPYGDYSNSIEIQKNEIFKTNLISFC